MVMAPASAVPVYVTDPLCTGESTVMNVRLVFSIIRETNCAFLT